MSERKDTRIIAGIGVVVTIDGKPEPALTGDISRGGLFVLTRRVAKKGEVVQLKVVHQDKRLSCNARVVAVKGNGMSLSFIDATDEFRNALRAIMDDLVQEKCPEPSPDETKELRPAVAWSNLPGGSWPRFWHERLHEGELTGLALEGASIRCRATPEVGATVIVHLRDPGSQDGALQAQAEVVRLTGDSGFAVRFISPSIEFRQFVSRARRSKFFR